METLTAFLWGTQTACIAKRQSGQENRMKNGMENDTKNGMENGTEWKTEQKTEWSAFLAAVIPLQESVSLRNLSMFPFSFPFCFLVHFPVCFPDFFPAHFLVSFHRNIHGPTCFIMTDYIMLHPYLLHRNEQFIKWTQLSKGVVVH